MSFDLQISNQSEILENKFKAAFYQKLHEASKKTGWIKLSGFGVGVVSGISTIAKQVALIAENIIKGLANILGAAFFEKCSFSTGMTQLCSGSIKELIILPFSIFSAALGLITKTLNIATRPDRYTHWRWCAHDPVEKAAEQIRQDKIHFDNLKKNLEKNPNDAMTLRWIAKHYEDGLVVEKDEKTAFDFYLKAADLGDVNSMIKVGNYYKEGVVIPKDDEAALKYFLKAAEKDKHGGAMIMAGKCLEEKNEYKEAIKYYEQAMIKGYGEAYFLKGKMLHLGLGLPKDEECAVKHYRNAADRNNEDAVCYLVVMLEKYPHLQNSPKERERWIKRVESYYGVHATKICADLKTIFFRESDSSES